METIVSLFYEAYITAASLFHWRRRNARFIVLLGGPGAGKGTLAATLAAKFGIPHLNMGSILRREITEQTDIGREWGPAIKAGKLIPDAVIHKLLRRELAKRAYDNGAVLDGIPRTADQAKRLRRMLASLGNRVEVAIELDVDRPDLLERLALRRTCTKSDCGRSYHLKFLPPRVENTCDICGSPLMQRDDERPESIITRMEEFARTFAPLRAFYVRIGLLKVVRSTNAMGPEKVFDEVLFALDEHDCDCD